MFRRKRSQDNAQSARAGSIVGGSKSSRTNRRLSRRAVLILICIALLIGVGGSLLVVRYMNTDKSSDSTNKLSKSDRELKETSKYVREGNDSKAIDSARRAVEEDPSNLTALETLASLLVEQDPKQAKEIYARALKVYKSDYNLDKGGGTAINYWAAATLAENAGRTNEAKQLYQLVIDTAEPGDDYQQLLARQSQAALERL